MKICFITKDICQLGGVQRVVSILSNELIKYYDIDIVCTESNEYIDRTVYNLNERINVMVINGLVDENTPTRIIHKILKVFNNRLGVLNNNLFYKIALNSYFPKSVINKVSKFLNYKNYDIVIGVEGYYSLLIGALSDKISSKTIGWQHNSYDAYFKERGRYYYNQDILFKNLIGNLDRYIVLNDYDKNKLLCNKKINSIAISNAKSFKSDKKSKLNENNFLAAGRFNYQKGFDLLIESFNLYVKSGGKWNLILVGDGEEKNKIIGMINDYNLNDRVQIKPFTKNIQKYFLKSSTLLLPSRWEGMPMITLEALEMGVPIISYDISAIKPIISNRKEGIIVKKYEVSEFACAMKEISESKNLKYELAENAIKKSRDFDIDNISKKWISLLKQI